MVTITGSDFSGATATSLCYVPATFALVNASTLTAQVPAGACDGLWRITNRGVNRVAASAFTVTSAVVISRVSPGGAPAGATVVLTGNNLAGEPQGLILPCASH